MLTGVPLLVVALLSGLAFCTRVIGAQEASIYTGPVAALAAAVWNGQTDRVQSLLDAGEDPNAPEGTPALTPWQIAILAGHQPSLDLFARHAATRPARHYTVPLFKTALQRGDARMVAEFIRAGVALQFGPAEYSPLSIAAASGYVEVLRVLLDAHADVDAQDRFGDTALMAAVRGGRLEAVQLLLDRGASVAMKDTEGHTAMTWAHKAGRASVISALRNAGADMLSPAPSHASPTPALSPRAAVERSLQLLQRGGATWNERAACASCHTQGMLLPVVTLAREKGFAVDAALAKAQEARLRQMVASFEPAARGALRGEEHDAVRFALGFYGQMASGGALLQLAFVGTERLPLDEVIAVAIGRTQLSDGRWRTGAPRVPLHESDIQTTALVVRVLRGFAPANEETGIRVRRASAWLLSSMPTTSAENAYRLLGLLWADADTRDIRAAAHLLMHDQDAQGGWAQLPGMNVDAYATGVALVALHESGISPADPHYQRGVAYLLRTQEADGSWFVPKRAASFNPYFDSGFPYGKHQYSSFIGTGWAAMAVMHAADTIPGNGVRSPLLNPSPVAASTAGGLTLWLRDAFLRGTARLAPPLPALRGRSPAI
jgi:hypothetical protein